jgi:3-hydroxybutyryl-CoA dehydrogenase
VAVIGAGTIGRGVAQSLAENGFEVVLADVSDSQLASAKDEIGRHVRLFTMYGHSRADADGVLDRITFTTSLEQVARAGLVVENVTENWDVKRQVYLALDSLCPDPVVFAVNTSAIPITRVAALTRRPGRVVGLHFMNPVPLIRTVEVVRGHHTTDATLQLIQELLGRLGKEGIVVQDLPGFITNRVLMLTINEAIECVHDQIASASDVDRIAKGCFSHKLGPLETADLIGLDTVLNSLTVLFENYNDGKYRPAPLLRRMVDAGLLGRKSGEGFYKYTAGRSGGKESHHE